MPRAALIQLFQRTYLLPPALPVARLLPSTTTVCLTACLSTRRHRLRLRRPYRLHAASPACRPLPIVAYLRRLRRSDAAYLCTNMKKESAARSFDISSRHLFYAASHVDDDYISLFFIYITPDDDAPRCRHVTFLPPAMQAPPPIERVRVDEMIVCVRCALLLFMPFAFSLIIYVFFLCERARFHARFIAICA